MSDIIKLRDYQHQAITDICQHLNQHPCCVAPTGAGKTVIATALVNKLSVPTLWLAHRKELIEQGAKHLSKLGLNTGIIMAGYDPFPLAQVQVASVQTLNRREKPNAELIIIDEAHHAAADSYQSIIDEYPGVPVVGFTATPFRLDGRGLGDLFGELVLTKTVAELCAMGYLHKPRVWCAAAPDLQGLKIRMGDYSASQLSGRTNTSEHNANIIAHWQKHANGLKTVVFACDVAHSIAICEAFRSAGVKAEHIDSTIAGTERDAILKRLAKGETAVVSNCMVLTEGWDLPALQCCILARPTASLNLHLQMIGRVMRATEGKDGAIVLDHAGNHHEHGLVTRKIEYTLDGGASGAASDPLGLRRCPVCGLMYEITTYACPECGSLPPKPEPRAASDAGMAPLGDLSEFDDTDYTYRANYWLQIEAEREDLGYQPGWSFYRFKDRFDTEPVVAFGQLVDPENATFEQRREIYRQFLEKAVSHDMKPDWASYRYKDIFGCWPKGFVTEVKREYGIETDYENSYHHSRSSGNIQDRFNALMHGG